MTLQAVGDLRDVATLGSMGVGATELGRWPPTECQRVGGAAAWLQWDGLLVPSARADGLNLVVFPDHMNPDALLEVIDSIIL